MARRSPARTAGVPRIADDRASLEGLLAGQVDVAPAVSHDHVERLRARDDVVLQAARRQLAFRLLKQRAAAWTDAGEAGDRHAIDRAAWWRASSGARRPRATPASRARVRNGTPELVLDVPRTGLLKEAGTAQGSPPLLVPMRRGRTNPDPIGLRADAADSLGEIGVQSASTAPGWGAFLERATRGAYDMAVMGWQADTPDPNDFLSVLLGSEFVGATNRSRYRSPAMDILLKQGRRGDDQRERMASYVQAQALFRRDMPWIPLFHVSVFTVHRRSVHGLAIGPTGIPRYDRVWKTA